MKRRRVAHPRYRVVTVRVDEETWHAIVEKSGGEAISTWVYRRLMEEVGTCRANDRSR